MFEHVTVLLNAGGGTFLATKRRIGRVVARGLALFGHRSYWARYRLLVWKARHGSIFIAAVIFLLICVSTYFLPVWQSTLEPYLSAQDRLADLRSVFLALGSALIGAAAIAFSLVMFAMQVNVERMPHGLFRRLSADKRIIGAFGGTFLIAISVACASLIPDVSWAAMASLASAWGIVLIFGLFLYAYRRALLLINPIKQLHLLVNDASHEMRAWVRRAKRAAPLFGGTDSGHDVEDGSVRSTHDLQRTAYFQVNPHWTIGAQQAIQHAISFTRRYVEHGDHEVSGAALSAVVKVNQAYVEAKGKTFFANYSLVDNPLCSDGFINDTLEHLRQNIRIGISRGDEQQIEQTLRAMATLVQVYIRIDYSDPHGSKTHAHLAATYLSGAVKSVAPHDMADVLMEGVRLMGQSAHLLLAHGEPSDIVALADEIGLVANIGVVNEKYRPVTVTAVDQLARLTFALIRTKAHHVGFASDRLKENVAMVAKLLLGTAPDTPLASVHRANLGPYYSTQSLLSWLTDLVSALAKAKPEDETAKTVIRNIEDWADGLYRTEKELLLLAIEKRSHFTFDMIHWIARVTKFLLAVSNTPACDDHTGDKLRKHALWLISTLSWVPDDEETVTFVENYGMTETLFEAAIDAYHRDCLEVSEKVRGLLLGWAFNGGGHPTGWAILERSMYGIATLALITENSQVVEDLKRNIADRLAKPDAPDQQIRDRTARDIRSRATTLYREGHWSSHIEHEMSRVDRGELRSLLEELANILSPETVGEPVDIDFY